MTYRVCLIFGTYVGITEVTILFHGGKDYNWFSTIRNFRCWFSNRTDKLFVVEEQFLSFDQKGIDISQS